MSGRRTAIVSASVATAAVAGGVVGRELLRRRRGRGAHPHLSDLPPQDLGPVVSFDGTELAVRASGDPGAPTLLFVHGFSLDMTTWHEQWVDLSSEFRCVLMDQRSHGNSGQAAGGDVSTSAMAHDVAAVLDAVAPDRRVVLVGHSMGAMAILALAESRPELFGPRIAGVVLVGTTSADLLRGAMGSVTELLRPRLGTFFIAARRMDRLRKAVLASPGDVSGAIVRLTQFGPDAPSDLVNHVVSLAGRAQSHVWTDGLAGLMEVDLRHAVRHVSVPALVVVGEHDRVTPPAAAVELAGELPKGSLVVLEGAGHMAMLERPRELNDHLRAFANSAFAEPGNKEPGSNNSKRKRKPA
ncbi:MAG: alpha/beta hydrolase [Actinobacteria bacterium]|nr:alpha/beta hydrolase [Actinomycetota bacterium]